MTTKLYAVWISLLAAPVLPGAELSVVARTPAESVEVGSLEWNGITGASLTPDGIWLTYASVPMSGQGAVTVVARNVAGNLERRYPAGAAEQGAGELHVSSSGKWIAFKSAGSGTASTDVALVELQNGTRRDFRGVANFQFAGRDDHECLVLQDQADAGARTIAAVRVQPLVEADAVTLSEVTTYAVDPSGERIAWANGGGLSAMSIRSRKPYMLAPASSGFSFEALTWSGSGRALAFIGRKDGNASLLAVRWLGADPAPLQVYDSQTLKGFPQEYALVPSLEWQNDETGLFFAMRPLPVTPAPGDYFKGLSIWHARDEYLPVERAELNKRFEIDRWGRMQMPDTVRCFVDVASGKWCSLNMTPGEKIELSASASRVLGYTAKPYGWKNAGVSNGKGAQGQVRDYFLVDLPSGRRTPVAKALQVWPRHYILPRLSPNGRHVIFDDRAGNVVAFDTETGRQRVISSGAATRFYYPEDNPESGWLLRDNDGIGSTRVQGWTRDGNYVLMSDRFDVWALPLREGVPLNLTQNGRAQEITYTRCLVTDPALQMREPKLWQAFVDLDEGIYFEAWDHEHARSGFGRWDPASKSLAITHWEDAALQCLKAARADVFVYSKGTVTQPQDLFRVGPEWGIGEPLTQSCPPGQGLRLTAGSKYLSYARTVGPRGHAILYLPPNYEPGKTYPTIVEIYKGFSTGIHGFRGPKDYLQKYLQRGYAVLQPDILPRLNEPGRAAYEDVMAGVTAAIETGVVDRDRMGIMGHSYGAYETNFIITQTNLFKAAVSHAGVADLAAKSRAVYQSRWPNRTGDQPYIKDDWSENPDVYARNSPVTFADRIQTPLMLVHGTRDEAVLMEQSIALFNAMRQIDRTDVVLLEYIGQAHDFYNPTVQEDFDLRRLAFFDHFLKGAPAPAWWADGKSVPDGQVPVESR